MQKRIFSALSASALSLAVLISTCPAAAENVLRFTIGIGGAVTMDPHSRWNAIERPALQQVYETLLDIDSDLAIVPQLALDWKPLDSTTWEFGLRLAVTFHDGTPFTAEDVLFSIERARADTSWVKAFVSNIAAVSAVDDHTVQIKTTAPDPLLWMRLSNVAIMSAGWARTHDVLTPTHVDGGKETFASRHANGTGPFILEEFEPHGRWVMVRNPSWWGAAEYDHNIDRIVHTYKSYEENLAALLDGEIDLLVGPLYSGLDAIQRNPDLKLMYRPKLFTVFFGFDQGSAELRTSNVKGRNPFKDQRVRQAIAHAIDMEPALRPVMGEFFFPAGMLPAPGMNGYAPELNQPVPYDPERARALLAEAGYPNGFSVTLDCPNEWGDDEIAACKGAADQLDKVGIDVAINFLGSDDLIAKVETRHESDFFEDSWDMDPDSERVLTEFFKSQSKFNMVGYVNPRVDELIEKIKIEMVTYARDAHLAEAWQIVTDDVAYLPIRHGVSVFAMRKELDIPPDPWDVPRFRLARFKEEAKAGQQ
jgi:peptide/nickel transport system substrate-binding protein